MEHLDICHACMGLLSTLLLVWHISITSFTSASESQNSGTLVVSQLFANLANETVDFGSGDSELVDSVRNESGVEKVEILDRPTELFIPCDNDTDSQKCQTNKNFLKRTARQSETPVTTQFELLCPEGRCLNGGTCHLSFGTAVCSCLFGFGGKLCEIKLRDCNSNKCAHSSRCVKLVDVPTAPDILESDYVDDAVQRADSQLPVLPDFQCLCEPGWMGILCDRPCRDIYKSCTTWQERKFCDEVRFRTRFFDINCAATCDQCTLVNDTIPEGPPLPPILNSLKFLVGVWQNNFSRPWRYPVDFPPGTPSYTETITVKPLEVPMFDTPSLAFQSITVNPFDTSDERMINGYLKVRKVNGSYEVALLCASNDGMTMIEKGTLTTTDFLELQMNYMQMHGLTTTSKATPAGGIRTFKKVGDHNLEMYVKKLGKGGSMRLFKKYFYKIDGFKF